MTHTLDAPSIAFGRRVSKASTTGPIKAHDAMDVLIGDLELCRPHEIRSDADEIDIRERVEHLEHVWTAVDRYLLAIGAELKFHRRGIDLSMFQDQLRGALEGNATHVLNEEANAIEQGED